MRARDYVWDRWLRGLVGGDRLPRDRAPGELADRASALRLHRHWSHPLGHARGADRRKRPSSPGGRGRSRRGAQRGDREFSGPSGAAPGRGLRLSLGHRHRGDRPPRGRLLAASGELGVGNWRQRVGGRATSASPNSQLPTPNSAWTAGGGGPSGPGAAPGHVRSGHPVPRPSRRDRRGPLGKPADCGRGRWRALPGERRFAAGWLHGQDRLPGGPRGGGAHGRFAQGHPSRPRSRLAQRPRAGAGR